MLIFFVLIFKKKASKAKIKKRLTSSDKPPRLFSIIITNHNKLKSFNQKFRKFWYKPNMHIKKKLPVTRYASVAQTFKKHFTVPFQDPLTNILYWKYHMHAMDQNFTLESLHAVFFYTKALHSLQTRIWDLIYDKINIQIFKHFLWPPSHLRQTLS